jgi:hypothetical protein
VEAMAMASLGSMLEMRTIEFSVPKKSASRFMLYGHELLPHQGADHQEIPRLKENHSHSQNLTSNHSHVFQSSSFFGTASHHNQHFHC